MVTSHITDRISGTWATSLMLHNRGRGHFRFWNGCDAIQDGGGKRKCPLPLLWSIKLVAYTTKMPLKMSLVTLSVLNLSVHSHVSILTRLLPHSLHWNPWKRIPLNIESDSSNFVLKMLLKMSFAGPTVLNRSPFICININQLFTRNHVMPFQLLSRMKYCPGSIRF